MNAQQTYIITNSFQFVPKDNKNAVKQIRALKTITVYCNLFILFKIYILLRVQL